MASDTPRLWFSDKGKPFRGNEPFYFDTARFPWVAEVEARWEVIRDELMAELAQDDAILEPYVNKDMVTHANRWRTLGLMFWTRQSRENCARFPKTWSILRTIPGLTAASFNLLEANATIKPHMGDTNAIIRCHLGLIVPGPAPRCAFRVGTETRSWEPGRFLMFCDAYEHSAWNNTGDSRYILVVDVMRPEFMRSKFAIASRVLTGIYQDVAYKRRSWLRRYFGSAPARAAMATLFRGYCRLSLYRHGVASRRAS